MRPAVGGIAGVLSVLLVAACGGESDTTTPTAPPLGKLLNALIGAADHEAQPWRCAAADVPALADEQVTIGDHAWTARGHTLHREGDGAIVIGVVADAAGAAPRTIAALGRIRAVLDAAKPDVVLTLGGMGATAAELEATLGTLSDHARWPLVALPGDLEGMPAHLTALGTLRTRGDHVYDGRQVRWVELGGATIGTIPGAGAAERLVAAGDGCGWQAADISALTTELTGHPGIRILASSEAPRQTVDGEPAGELALTPSDALPVDVVIHGPVAPGPSAPHTGVRDGAGVLVTPGTADATPRLPRAHQPSAGVLVVRGGSWTWKPLVDAK